MGQILCVKKVLCVNPNDDHSNYVGPPALPTVVMSNPLIHLQTNDQQLTMKCVPDTEGVNYTWEKRYSTLPSRAQGVNTPTMIIVNLKPEDSGEYRCVITNSTGRIFSEYTSVVVRGMK